MYKVQDAYRGTSTSPASRGSLDGRQCWVASTAHPAASKAPGGVHCVLSGVHWALGGGGCVLGGAHLAEVPQLHDLDVVGTELDDALLVFDGDQLPHRLAVLARDHLVDTMSYV